MDNIDKFIKDQNIDTTWTVDYMSLDGYKENLNLKKLLRDYDRSKINELKQSDVLGSKIFKPDANMNCKNCGEKHSEHIGERCEKFYFR